MKRTALIMTALLTLAAPMRAHATPEADAFTLSSPDFTDGGVLNSRYSCDQTGVSPPLHWDNVPEHSKSFALSVDDPDAPGGDHVHWIVYNLPDKTRDIPAGASAQAGLGLGAEQGLNGSGKAAFDPACPPTGEHHYIFKVYALDTMLSLPTGTTVDKKAFDAALQGHVLGQAELTARYARHK